MPTPLNAERPNSAWYHIRGGVCFRRPATPLHLHKSRVARFLATVEFLVLVSFKLYVVFFGYVRQTKLVSCQRFERTLK